MPASVRYGISYEIFWKLNPKIMGIYQEEYLNKQKQMDYNLWSLGIYMQSAVASALNKNNKYFDKPISELLEEKQLSDEEKFKLWIAEFNSRFEEKES